MKELDEFTQGYVECLLWSECMSDEDGNCLGNFDDTYGPENISPEGLEEIIRDCADFQESNVEDLDEYEDDHGMTRSQAGHDFCLTRNGHGAGFWDRGTGDVGDRLTKASKPYGTQSLYVIDDDTIGVGN